MSNVAAHPKVDIDFAPFIGGVARLVWGDANKGLSSRDELRWGAHGSKSVDLSKGTFFDHEANEGGGVLDLLRREKGLDVGQAFDWLRREGFDVPDRQQAAPAPKSPPKIVATYDYVNEDGEVVFQVVRFEPKDFRQRRPDPSGRDGWSWSVKGLQLIPYRLPDLIEALAMERRVCIVEGEKDVEALWKLGIPATCNPMGAGKWPEEFARYFRGADVVILPDNDAAGRNHCEIVAANLAPVARSVGVVDLPQIGPKGDVSDWIANVPADQARETLEVLIEDLATPWRPAAPASRFGALLWRDLTRHTPATRHLIEDILFPGDIALTYGESRAGKSFLAIDMSLAVARGIPFFGLKTARGPVAYQAGEGATGVHRRLLAYGLHHALQAADLPFVFLKSKVDLYSPEGDVDEFIAELRSYAAWFGEPMALVNIDTFSAATPGANENASEDVSRIISNIKRIREATGAAVNVVHHKNAGGQKARGHTSLFADADAAIDVCRDEETNHRDFRLAKVKDGEDGKRFGFALQPVDIGSNDDGKTITSCVVVPAQEDDPRTGKRTRLPAGQRRFLMSLDDTILHRGGQLPLGERIPHNMRGVEWESFKDFYRAISAEKDDGAIRTALSRDGGDLLNDGLIGKHERWIWITDKGRAVLQR